ncbi:MAG: hypothetical protein JNM17_09635 [Archangium sp.]|nr:hypothetical protein [Archangium sp.]
MSAAVLISLGLVLGQIQPAFQRLDAATGLDGVRIGLDDGSMAFGSKDAVLRSNYSESRDAYALTATNGVSSMKLGIDFRDVWRSGEYLSFTSYAVSKAPTYPRPLAPAAYRFRCVPDRECVWVPVFVALVPGHSDTALYGSTVAWLRREKKLIAPIFEAPASKNPRERSEIFFDPSDPQFAGVAAEFAFLLRPLLGSIQPKPWPGGAMPSPHHVVVIVGKQRVPEAAPPKMPDAAAPKVTVVRGAVTAPTRERLRTFLLSHTFGLCSAIADGGTTCTRSDDTEWNPGPWSTSDAGFRLQTVWEPGRWGAPLYAVEATAMNDELVLGTRPAGWDEPDALVAWVCDSSTKKCVEVQAPAVKVLGTPAQLRAIETTRFDDLKQPSGALAAPVFIASGTAGSKLSITYSWMWRAHAIALAERLAPVLGPIPLTKAPLPLSEVEEPYGVVLDLGK